MFVEINDLITHETYMTIRIAPRCWEVAEQRKEPPTAEASAGGIPVGKVGPKR